MKIYKISQINPQNQQEMQKAAQEIMEATSIVGNSVATINQGLKIIADTGVEQLFKKETLINAIQSGDTSQLDINKVNQALQAMTNISQTIPIMNQAFRTIDENKTISIQMGMDSRSLMNTVMQSLNSGDYSQFTAILNQFQSGLSGMSGTMSPTFSN